MSETLDTDLTVKLDAIQSLAEVAQTALPLGMNAIFKGPDGVLAISRPPRPARLKFFAEDLSFNVAVSPEARDSVCQIWAEIGHVPYTVESVDRRRNVLTVLRAAEGLARARFVVENGQKILLVADSHVPGHVTAERLIYEAVMLIQEARPFLRLLAEEMGG
ncbi:MAG: hypothetical protein WCO00_13130 [Rhodospirillaceae bacterium]